MLGPPTKKISSDISLPVRQGYYASIAPAFPRGESNRCDLHVIAMKKLASQLFIWKRPHQMDAAVTESQHYKVPFFTRIDILQKNAGVSSPRHAKPRLKNLALHGSTADDVASALNGRHLPVCISTRNRLSHCPVFIAARLLAA